MKDEHAQKGPVNDLKGVSLLLDAGIPLAFGSDAPANPRLDIRFATNPGNRASEGIIACGF
jgi:predicted amidohydrolase YtcJ